MSSPLFGIRLLKDGGQDRAEVIVNSMHNFLECQVHLAVEDRDLATPPGSPTSGQTYIVGSAPTGVWSGKTGYVATWLGEWIFSSVREGTVLWVKDEDLLLLWDGAAYKRIGTQAAAVADISTSISNPPTQSEVTAIKTKVNDLLAALRATGLLAT